MNATLDETEMSARVIIFKVTGSPDGGYDARALGHSIFAQGKDQDNLRAMVREADICHFGCEEVPRAIRFCHVRDEAIAV